MRTKDVLMMTSEESSEVLLELDGREPHRQCWPIEYTGTREENGSRLRRRSACFPRQMSSREISPVHFYVLCTGRRALVFYSQDGIDLLFLRNG